MMRTEETGSAKKVVCSKPGGSGDRKGVRPKERFCDDLEEDVPEMGADIGGLIYSQRRSGRNSLRRSSSTCRDLVPIKEEEEVRRKIVEP